MYAPRQYRPEKKKPFAHFLSLDDKEAKGPVMAPPHYAEIHEAAPEKKPKQDQKGPSTEGKEDHKKVVPHAEQATPQNAPQQKRQQSADQDGPESLYSDAEKEAPTEEKPLGRSENPPSFKLQAGPVGQLKSAQGVAPFKVRQDADPAKNTAQSKENGLPEEVKAKMEGAFQTNFDDVQITPNSHKAKEAGALAFAQGNEIHFAPGQYNPASKGGQELLGHELAHVVQQREGRVKPTAQVGGMAVNDDKALEAEADRMGGMAASYKGGREIEAVQGRHSSSNILDAHLEPKNENQHPSDGVEVGKDVAANNSEQDDSREAEQGHDGKDANIPRNDVPVAEKQPSTPKKLGEAKGIGGNSPAPKAPKVVALDSSASGPLVHSLANEQPTVIAANFNRMTTQLPAAQKGDVKNAEEFVPEVVQPTGLDNTKGGNESVKPTLSKGDEPELKGKDSGKVQKVETSLPRLKEEVPTKKMGTPKPEELKQPSQYKLMVSKVPEVDSSLSTKVGPRPKVELTGKADPKQNQAAFSDASDAVMRQRQKADQETARDFGESHVMPQVEPEDLHAMEKIQGPAAWNGGEIEEMPEMDAETTAAVDQGFSDKYASELADSKEKEAQAKAEFDEKANAEKEKGLQKVEEENEKVKQQQIAEREKGKAQVDQHRRAWDVENEKVLTEFDKKGKSKRQEVEGKIQTKVGETNRNIATEYAAAEKKATSETQKARAAAAKKKEESAKKSESKSIWDRMVGAVGDFFKALKDAVSAIFNALRALVTAIIEGAKKLAARLIDMARDAIKGLISAFAAALKVFVKFALAAFPSLAKRFCDLIDKAVKVLQQVIDLLAESLKTFVYKLLDLVSKAIKLLLDAYEAYIKAILDVLKFLTVGLIMAARAVANLVLSAKESPDHFWSQLSEEMLGTDVTKPLPNEYAAADEAAVTSQEAPDHEVDSTSETSNESVSTGNIEAADQAILERESYVSSDFQVPVVSGEQLEPELASEVENLGEGDHEFANFDDNEHGPQALKAEFSGANSPSEGENNASNGTGISGEGDHAVGQKEGSHAESVSENATTTPIAAPPGKDRDRFSLDQNNMVGPFKTYERIGYLGLMVWRSAKTWISQNWLKIGAAVVAAILLILVTGGAILGLVPIFLTILSAYFAAQTLASFTKHIVNYLTFGAVKETRSKGAVSLARAIAIGLIELVTSLPGFKASMKGIQKAVKAGMKGGIKGLSKHMFRMARRSVMAAGMAVVDSVRNAGKNLLKAGKFVLSGLKKGFSAGAKSLGALAQRLGKAFKFRKFRFRIKNGWWRLEGKMNPWVLLSEGPLQGHVMEVDEAMKKELLRKKSAVELTSQDVKAIAKHQPELVIPKSPKRLLSTDPMMGSIVDMLEKLGTKVLDVEKKIPDRGLGSTDIDIVTKDFVIQIKSGTTKNVDIQLRKSMLEEPGKIGIAYGPEIKSTKFSQIEAVGGYAYDDIWEFIKAVTGK